MSEAPPAWLDLLRAQFVSLKLGTVLNAVHGCRIVQAEESEKVHPDPQNPDAKPHAPSSPS